MTSSQATRAIARIVVALAIGMLALVASPGPASAGPSTSDAGLLAGCPADSLCFYNDKDFNGPVFIVPAGHSFPNLHLFACPGCNSPHSAGDGNFGDQMSAWVNNTSLAYCWYFDINYGRYVTVMPAGQAVAWVGKGPQDEASSVRPC